MSIDEPRTPAMRMAAQAQRRAVLVVGAGGFIGSHIAAAFHRAGWQVRRTLRDADRRSTPDACRCDLARMRASSDWHPLLEGIDAVVNAAGILRETAGQRFEAIHVQAPLALAQACIERGVRVLVQVSALGEEADGAFIASKHRADRALLALPLRVVVLRPSVVYSASGSYGGTSLLRALAALPGVVPVPGHGRWPIQPLAAEDLAELVVRAAASEAAGLFEVGGPRPMPLTEYLRHWRRWMGLPSGRLVTTPGWLVSVAAARSDRFGRGAMGRATWRMLRRGNVTADGAGERLQERFGFAPRALEEVLAAHPSHVQDRWHARLLPLHGVLRLGVVALFLLSAWVGLTLPAAQIDALSGASALAGAWAVDLARASGVLDLMLGLWLLVGWRERAAVAAMAVLVLGYTLAFGLLWPWAWLDPLGGLAKNLVVLPALAVLWVTSDRR